MQYSKQNCLQAILEKFQKNRAQASLSMYAHTPYEYFFQVTNDLYFISALNNSLPAALALPTEAPEAD